MAPLTSNVHEMRGRTDIAHIPPMPLWVAIIRIFQAILAIVVLSLTAYADSVFKYTFAGFGIAWFTVIWTLFFLGYIGISAAFVPTIYNMWIHLGLECLTTLWWLATVGVLGSEASAWDFATDLDPYLPSNWNSAINAAKSSPGMSALEWILFIITLVTFGISFHKHRLANGMGTMAAAPPGAPMTEQHKMHPIALEQPMTV